MRKVKNTDGSEFRRDLVSEDWILIAAKRAQRPHSRDTKKVRPKLSDSKKDCPFDNPQSKGAPAPLLWLPHPKTKNYKLRTENLSKDWWVQIIPNKYPALSPHDICPVEVSDGPHLKMGGVGFHEIIITRDHQRRISEMTLSEVETLLYAYQERYHAISGEECINYILIFHNQGPKAGATIFHPHSQLIAMPIIPPDVSRSLEGSKEYYERKRKCVHCAMLSWEQKKKERIVHENRKFLVIEPFASRVSYETRIFSKSHQSHFDEISAEDRTHLAQAMSVSLKKIKKALDDPDYNFFIHTAPAKDGTNNYYHWHMEILPKTSIWAGLELGTGIEVVAVPPEEAAALLRKF